MCYVYIPHLDGDSDGALVAELQRTSKLKVQEAKESSNLLPNQVLVVPSHRKMQVLAGAFKLELKPVKTGSYMPINEFFSSLADEYRGKAIGILLSGNAPDGTLRLKAIKAAGGITFAQDSTAEFHGLPKNAIAKEVVDLVLSPKRIAEELAKLADHHDKYPKAPERTHLACIPGLGRIFIFPIDKKNKRQPFKTAFFIRHKFTRL